MKIERVLEKRANGQCELCQSKEGLSAYTVQPEKKGNEGIAVVCSTCKTQIENPDSADANHWRCLNDSMWSEVPGVQIIAYRMLHHLKSEGWPQDLIDMMYLDEDMEAWAKAGLPDEDALVHVDCNGAKLEAGDTVVLIQDLNVKGSSITAKRGVAVRRITLDPNNAEYIEGKVDGQHIVILTKYVKKSK